MKNQQSTLSGKGSMQVPVWLIFKITFIVLIIAAFLDGLTAIMMDFVDPHIQQALPFSAYAYMATFATIETGVLFILFAKPRRRSKRVNDTLSLAQ